MLGCIYIWEVLKHLCIVLKIHTRLKEVSSNIKIKFICNVLFLSQKIKFLLKSPKSWIVCPMIVMIHVF